MDSSSSTYRSITTTASSTSCTSTELFICFNSRLSMKISAGPSILSPARARDNNPSAISLSTSSSRRLRTSRSIRNNGRASPMFTAAAASRRRGAAAGAGFDNPEPSSPKVTCIGQVRVKSKKNLKKGIKIRTLPRRQSGELSFRTLDHYQIQRQSSISSQYHLRQQNRKESLSRRNQRWVHLPSSICESLKGFGNEFNCLIPCKPSSCFVKSNGESKEEEKSVNDGGQSSCGDDEYDNDDDEEEVESPIRRRRRHVFDEIDIKDEIFEVTKDANEGDNMETEEEKVGICVPPKNALLLMRCRSDPVKLEALANRFWEPQLPKQVEEEEEEKEEDDEKRENIRNKEQLVVKVEKVQVKDEVKMVETEDLKEAYEEKVSVFVNTFEVQEEESEGLSQSHEAVAEEFLEMEVQVKQEAKQIKYEEQEETEEKRTLVEEDNEVNFATEVEILASEESEEDDEFDPMEDKNEDESRVSYSNASFSIQLDQDDISEDEEEEEEEEEETEKEVAALEKEIECKILELKAVEKVTQKGKDIETENHHEVVSRKAEEIESESNDAVAEKESALKLKKREIESTKVPDCLLLMICEPKLSMEVSKETWVCSTDFIRSSPEKKDPPAGAKQTDIIEKRVLIAESNSVNCNADVVQANQQPARSSSTFPAAAAAVSMATMIEQNLANAVGYEPFVLTRCKSEPMRRAANKLAPDGCFWKSGRIEPLHGRATFGIGSAEVGF